ncbi:molecular chaperone Hsp90, partial [Mangrovactinospora gilvigrisea]
PAEERLRPHWSVTWALPVAEDDTPLAETAAAPAAPVVHAPTPTDEPQPLPALLIASVPLDPTRRHLAPGPLADHLADRAAEGYVRLLRAGAPGEANLALVPEPLGTGGAFDGRLRAAVLKALPRTPILAAADGTAVRPDQAVVLESGTAELVAALSDVVAGLLPAGLERHRALPRLGVRRLAMGELVDSLAGLEREPSWWHRLYAALARSAADPDALGSLPVPLADGRSVLGPRRVLLWDASFADGDGGSPLDVLDLKVAHPEASHPLLEKLGAAPASPAAALTSPQVRAAVARSLDESADDPAFAEETAEAVLRLVRAASPAPGEHPWLAALALTDDYGDPAPAGELALPGSPLAELLDPEEAGMVADGLVERWGSEVLLAVGVAAEPVLLGADDAVLDPDDPDALELPVRAAGEGGPAVAPDGIEEWCEDVLDEAGGDGPVPPVAAELLAVRDLDLVAEDAWPRALGLLARPPLRAAVTEPVRVLLPDGSVASAPSYTAWWLRGHPVLGGRRPSDLRAPDGDPLLAGLFDEAAELGGVAGLDEAFLRAVGVRTSLAALLDEPDGVAEVLARLADPERALTPAQLRALYGALAEAEPDAPADERPDLVRALGPSGTSTAVVDAAEAIVATSPDLLPLVAGRALLPVPPECAEALADLLGVPTAEEVAGGRVLSEGEVRELPEVLRELLPDAPERYEEHDRLVIVGPDGAEAELDWRWDRETATLHAATLDGLARGAAWSASAWHRRYEAAALLADPSLAPALAAERLFE